MGKVAREIRKIQVEECLTLPQVFEKYPHLASLQYQEISEENKLNEEDNFTKPFSFYYDFPGNLQLYDIKDSALAEIFERITQDIFNETLAKW